MFEPLVSKELFARVQARLAASRAAWRAFRARTAADVLADLEQVAARQGRITIETLAAEGLDPEFYRKRFGGMAAIRRRLSVLQPGDVRLERMPARTQRRRALNAKLRAGFAAAGQKVSPVSRRARDK